MPFYGAKLMKYPIAIEPGDKDTAFGVVVPDLPGCFSAGDDLEEAMENVKESISLWLESTLSDKVERINITLPSRALRRLDLLTKRAGETRSGYLTNLIYSAT